jgi:vitamin B12 transporter
MRVFGICSSVFLLLIFAAAASAADSKDKILTVKVLDPQSAAVAGAQVSLLPAGSNSPLRVSTSSAVGVVSFEEIAEGSYRVQVLAAGFAVETVEFKAPHPEVITVQLHVAPANETVVVTATRTPVPSEDAGADVAALNGEQLETMNPVAADDALRFLPGAVVNTAGQRGGLSSLFVRGGNSNYNKVIVDGVSVTEAGGTIDFGTLSLAGADRMEFLRGTQSTLYGSDAMTSVVQVWTATGSTPVPELRFGADAGNYGTENGYASLAGAHGRFDYNVFGNQFNTAGSGPNDDYSNSLEGANLGFAVNQQVSLRLRFRHDTSATGNPGAWNFNGTNVFNEDGTTYVLAPDLGGSAHKNDIIGSFDLALKTGSNWTHHLTGFEYNLRTDQADTGISPQNTPFGFLNTPFLALVDINRAGFDYQGDYVERSWAHTTIGYEFEDENGSVQDPIPAGSGGGNGLRRNDAAYAQQALTLGRLNVIAGARFVHNTTFGNTGVPRVAAGYQVFRGGHFFSGTRLNGSFATGIKEPRFEETYVSSQYQLPNPNLKAERNRALEAGFQQSILGRFVLVANYYNNLFHDQIEFITVNQNTFQGQYQNLQKSLAHGAEAELQTRITQRLSWNMAYTYTSTQILEAAPGSDFYPDAAGDPFLRRPKHSATTLLTYLGSRWGGTLGGSFVGPRPDDDFEGFNILHAPGYFLLDLGGWYKINSHLTAYANVENALDHFYEEATGYPALRANFRAGMRFRFGGGE